MQVRFGEQCHLNRIAQPLPGFNIDSSRPDPHDMIHNLETEARLTVYVRQAPGWSVMPSTARVAITQRWFREGIAIPAGRNFPFGILPSVEEFCCSVVDPPRSDHHDSACSSIDQRFPHFFGQPATIGRQPPSIGPEPIGSFLRQNPGLRRRSRKSAQRRRYLARHTQSRSPSTIRSVPLQGASRRSCLQGRHCSA